MNRDQGLSIFEDHSEDSAGAQTTAVFPVISDSTERPGSRRPVQHQPSAGLARPSVAASTSGDLPQVRRGGYDRVAVDARLSQIESERQSLASRAGLAEKRANEREATVEKLSAQVAEVAQPSYAGLGGRATSMLRLAEEEADDVRKSAIAEATEIRERAANEAAALRATAQREAEDMRSVQLRELDETRTRVLAEANQERALAAKESADLRASAQRASDQLKLAAEQEVAELKTGAVRDAEKIRAGADREVAEARRTLAVEKERLAREASDHHSVATAETSRLVKDAEERAEAAELRAQEAMAQSASSRQAAQSEAEAMLSRARREAEQLVITAKSQVEDISSNSILEAQAQLAQIKDEVARMTKRRDSITAQLGALRDVMTGFDDDDTKPSA